VLKRRSQLDGDHYTLLGSAAEKLSQAHPLAATIALRSMVDFTLANARSSRYGHAAHLAAIRQNHARKSGFWKRMQDTGMAQSG
jgi:hypothetical protein